MHLGHTEPITVLFIHVHAENSKDNSRNSRKRGATSTCIPKSKRSRTDINKENLQAAKSEVCVKILSNHVQQMCLEQFMTMSCCSLQLIQANRNPPPPVNVDSVRDPPAPVDDDSVRDPPAPSNSDRVS